MKERVLLGFVIVAVVYFMIANYRDFKIGLNMIRSAPVQEQVE